MCEYTNRRNDSEDRECPCPYRERCERALRLRENTEYYRGCRNNNRENQGCRRARRNSCGICSIFSSFCNR
ncbi:MAG: hypothetical protein J6D23_03830 [Clostridia bacterium]|nr:hypothetical protein [Clostridia bacterium]